MDPPDCHPGIASSETWVQTANSSKEQTAGVFRYSAAPNLTPEPRAVAIAVGDQRFIVEQPAGRRTFFAAAPGRLVFTIVKHKPAKERSFTIISDEKTLVYTVTATESWIQVSAVNKSDSTAPTYTVRVDPSKLRGGHNQGNVYVTARGALSPPLAIPVVAEVPFVK